MSAEIAVLSGRGKTGRAVVSALTRAGAGARALGRAEAADLPGALSGCGAVYLMAPNMSADETGLVERTLTACEEVGIRRVVYHSVVAPYSPQMPHHLDKAVSEDIVRRSGCDWTILQPCAYIQNLLPGLHGDDPSVEVVYDLDTPFGLVDLEDVAEAAALSLLGDEHVGATYELGGPEQMTTRGLARIAEGVLDRPVRARQLTVREWSEGVGRDLDPRVRDRLLAMFAYYDRYGLPAGHRSVAALLGRRPRGVADVLRRDLA